MHETTGSYYGQSAIEVPSWGTFNRVLAIHAAQLFAADNPSTGSRWWDSAVGVALIVAVAGFLERRHQRQMTRLEKLNTDQHKAGYGLLESIDERTRDFVKSTSDSFRDIAHDLGSMQQWQVDHERAHDRALILAQQQPPNVSVQIAPNAIPQPTIQQEVPGDHSVHHS